MVFNSSFALGGHFLPGWAVGLHTLMGNGHPTRIVLLALVVACVYVDYRAMARVNASPTPSPVPTPGSLGLTADLRLGGRALLAGPAAFVSATTVMRQQRELAIGHYRAAGRPRRHSQLLRNLTIRKAQLVALLGGAATLMLAGAVAKMVSTAHDTPPANAIFLAGLLGDLARWWNDLTPTQQALVVAAAVAAALLLGAGIIGAATWARIGIGLATRLMLHGGLRGRAGYATGRFLSGFLDRSMAFRVGQLQHAFSHAAQFGVKGNWNKAGGEAHIRDRGTLVIQGRYRGEAATHFFNPRTGLNAFRDANGQFWSGWKLRPTQIQHLLRTGNLGGG
ncbi:colicin D domain-containing protein [Actinopolymorpha sp. B11F2]